MDHYGLVEVVARFLWVLCADDVMFGSRDPDWLHHLMNVLVGLFWRYGLADNITKSLSMTCQPGALRLGMSAEAKALKFTGVGESYRMSLRQRIHFPDGVVEITAGSMMVHHRRMHGMEP